MRSEFVWFVAFSVVQCCSLTEAQRNATCNDDAACNTSATKLLCLSTNAADAKTCQCPAASAFNSAINKCETESASESTESTTQTVLTTSTSDDGKKISLHPDILVWIGVTSFLVVSCLFLTRMTHVYGKKRKIALLAADVLNDTQTTFDSSPDSSPSSCKHSTPVAIENTNLVKSVSCDSVYQSVKSSVSDDRDFFVSFSNSVQK